VAELFLVRRMQRIFSCVLMSALITAAALPCAGQDQSETNFRKFVSALSGEWSIRETSDHGDTTGEEVWQGGTGGMPLTEEFRATTCKWGEIDRLRRSLAGRQDDEGPWYLVRRLQ